MTIRTIVHGSSGASFSSNFTALEGWLGNMSPILREKAVIGSQGGKRARNNAAGKAWTFNLRLCTYLVQMANALGGRQRS